MWARIKAGMPKLEAEDAAMTEWQSDWDSSTKGRWTYRFLPSVRDRKSRPLEFGHYSTQLISGHGDFNAKLSELGLAEDPTCSCGEEVEDADHALYRCPLGKDYRMILKNRLEADGATWPTDPVSLINSESRWTAFSEFASSILIRKETLRREEQDLQQI